MPLSTLPSVGYAVKEGEDERDEREKNVIMERQKNERRKITGRIGNQTQRRNGNWKLKKKKIWEMKEE